MTEQAKTREYYRDAAPFEADQAEKDAFFRKELKTLTDYHRKSCAAYDDICNGLGEGGPYIPVALFKDLALASVPEEEVVRQVTSSGTTGQQVSRIFLDAPTAELQRWALASITGDFIGSKRMPMLIIDSPDVLRDRSKFTARGAGILGFSMMSSKRFYALDEEMKPDWESIAAFQEAAKAGPSFAFGFTFMIWAYFVGALKKEGRSLDLSNCYLIHGGGWKKLQDQKVSDEEFRRALRELCGIEHVSDYYGMAEQTGSIFMQCDEGHLHASIYSDIEILDPEDFSPCEPGQWGLIALQSWIPGSYPGHRLLTEDRGRILGVDDCPCGRKGKYFEISGRISKAEIRGCSDTFEGAAGASPGAGAAGGLKILTGQEMPAGQKPLAAFDPLVMEFLEELSELFMKDPAYRQYPDIYALGFWLRPAHLKQLRRRQEENRGDSRSGGEEQKRGQGEAKRGGEEPKHGRGLVLHIAPSNMPTMFAYSWITALLAGCSSIVRLSEKESGISDTILQGISRLLDQPAYEKLRQRNAFVRFPRDHEALKQISEKVSARMIWGGDRTVEKICAVPKPEEAVDIGFPDKYSIALLDGDRIAKMSEEDLRLQANLFCRDTYGADQNACSSPRSVFWLGERSEEVKNRWWDAVYEESGRYEMAPWMMTEKYRILCRTYAQVKGLGQVKRRTNRVYVIPCGDASGWVGRSLPEGKLGIFYEFDLARAEDLMPLLNEKIQTAVCIGTDPKELYEQARQAECPGLDRAVCAGEALEFDTIWDRKDLIGLLTE